MSKIISKRLLLLGMLLLCGLTAQAQPTVVFKEAQRDGTDIPGSNLSWTFNWENKNVQIGSNGEGNIAGKTIQIPLNSTRLTGKLQYATYDGDLLLLVEETDEESAGGKLARFAAKTLKPKWTANIPAFNVGPGLTEGKFAYVSARAVAMKINLENGQWEWNKSNLDKTNESTRTRFNGFGLPVVTKNTVTFPERGGTVTNGAITFNKADGKVIEIR